MLHDTKRAAADQRRLAHREEHRANGQMCEHGVVSRGGWQQHEDYQQCCGRSSKLGACRGSLLQVAARPAARLAGGLRVQCWCADRAWAPLAVFLQWRCRICFPHNHHRH